MKKEKEKKSHPYIVLGIIIFMIAGVIWLVVKTTPTHQTPAPEPKGAYDVLVNIIPGSTISQIRCINDNGEYTTINYSFFDLMEPEVDYETKVVNDLRVQYRINYINLMPAYKSFEESDGFKKLVNNSKEQIQCHGFVLGDNWKYDTYDNGYKETRGIYLSKMINIRCIYEPGQNPYSDYKCETQYDFNTQDKFSLVNDIKQDIFQEIFR